MYNYNFERVNYVGFKERKVSESLARKKSLIQKSLIYNTPFNPWRSGEVDIKIMVIMNDVTMLEKVAFISFLFFYTVWFGYNFLGNR